MFCRVGKLYSTFIMRTVSLFFGSETTWFCEFLEASRSFWPIFAFFSFLESYYWFHHFPFFLFSFFNAWTFQIQKHFSNPQIFSLNIFSNLQLFCEFCFFKFVAKIRELFSNPLILFSRFVTIFSNPCNTWAFFRFVIVFKCKNFFSNPQNFLNSWTFFKPMKKNYHAILFEPVNFLDLLNFFEILKLFVNPANFFELVKSFEFVNFFLTWILWNSWTYFLIHNLFKKCICMKRWMVKND